MNIENLSDKYQLDTLEKNILSYCYKNLSNLNNMGIRKIAKDNFTSTSTIFKLAKKLGFNGYSDMIHNFTSTNNLEKCDNKDSNFSSPYSKINKEDIKTFSNLIKKYKDNQIMVVGLGFSQIVANYINERLLVSGFRSISSTHLELLSNSYKDKVLLIVISQSGQTPRLVDIISNGKRNGIEVLSFVGVKNSPIFNNSTLSFSLENYNNLADFNNVPNTFFGETILLFEYLFANSN